MLLLFKALVLGIVEGLTEFLPVSSTGHLIIAGTMIRYPREHAATFDIFIQLGATLAVFWHYRADLIGQARRVRHDPATRDFWGKVVLAFLPAALVGLLFHDAIETYLFNVYTVAGALIAGGVLLLIVERRPLHAEVTSVEATGWRAAFLIGAAQVTALFPGVSRAGATIIGGLLVGLSRPAATVFSFYLAMPTLAAASLFSLAKQLPLLTWGDAPPLAVGLLSAFVSALVVIRVFIAYVQTHDFRPFGYYRIVAGVLVYVVAPGAFDS
jgi:undecaprenyl-diphosphatase